ncbi:hypothetical protein BT63DRAFT_455664 [Microthyrium microscopicum]|uniref:BTB domain-containing protein n=1 Tax=Microthyrium microscopicum TaxID=703497 RepID=A0A6A6UDH1_9PEZI|nr:hypothetical protein BT63DRAFT_455664 [Microthyrium microscopicum]
MAVIQVVNDIPVEPEPHPSPIANLDWETALSSPTHTFEVGPSATPFPIHQSIIFHHSPMLSGLIANNSTTSFPEISPDVFALLSTFFYTGIYTSPQPTHIPPSPVATETQRAQSTPKTGAEAVRIPIERHQMRNLFYKHHISPNPSQSLHIGPRIYPLNPETPSSYSILRRQFLEFRRRFEGRSGVPSAKGDTLNGEDGSYVEVFRIHVELYMLASKWDIPSLRNLALARMYDSLAGGVVTELWKRDVKELMEKVWGYPVRDCYEIRECVELYWVAENEALGSVLLKQEMSAEVGGGYKFENEARRLKERIKRARWEAQDEARDQKEAIDEMATERAFDEWWEREDLGFGRGSV